MHYIYLPWHGSTYSFCQSSLQNIPPWHRLKDNHDRRPMSITYLTFTTSGYSSWLFTDLYLVYPPCFLLLLFLWLFVFFTQRACKVTEQLRQNLTRWSPYWGNCFTGVQIDLLPFFSFINLFTNYESPHWCMESKNLLGSLIMGFQHPVSSVVSPRDVI